MKRVRKHLTYANVMSSIAVFLMLGGATAFAATKIGANELKANSIKTGKIVKEAVTAGKLKNGAVTETKIADGAVTNKKIADNAVTSGKIADNAVTTGKIANDAVTNGKVANNAITSGKIANGAVTNEKLATAFLPAATAGVPVAGADVAADGTLRQFFNRFGGAPTVQKNGTGSYTLKFPGLEGKAFFSESIAMATLQSGPGEIRRTSSGGNPTVETYNSAGTNTDQAFDYVLFVPSP